MYPSHITTVRAKQTFKLKVLQESSETVIADLTTTEKGKVKSNLLFFTHNPKAWHLTFTQAFIHIKKNSISKGRQITVYEDEDKICPMFTINIYNNGIIMVQLFENCLNNFQNNF